MAETTDYAYFRETLIGFLGDSCELPNLSYSSWDKFANDYFKTDHHWQIMGAYSAYLEIMESLGREPVAIRGFHVAYDGPFYGSAARSGLDDDYWDAVYDIDYDASDYKVKVNGKEKPRSVVDKSLADDYKGYSKPSKFANVYADYFHTDWALLELDNPSAPDGTLLVIADSYSNCIERLFAESYRPVSVIDPRHYEGDLDAYLEKFDPDDVLVLMGANNIFGKETLALLE